MTPRFLVLAAAATIASAAPRLVSSQAIPDKPAPAPVAAKDSTMKDIDPVGTYTTYITAGGSAMTTTTRIEKRADGTYGGSVNGDGLPTLPVTSVAVAGNKVTVTVTAPDGGAATIEMIVTGEDVTGQWWMANDGSKLTGKKSP